jgi:cytoskeleton protein RodZ
MGAFGEKLRREREMRDVTLSEISESTKISKRSLQALEDEDFDLLPGGVFNRGFVRAYARYLGIDEEQAVADYVSASKEQQPSLDQFPLELHEDKEVSPPLNPKRSVLPIVLAVVALVLVVGGWWMIHKPPQPAGADQAALAGSGTSSPASTFAQPQTANETQGSGRGANPQHSSDGDSKIKAAASSSNESSGLELGQNGPRSFTVFVNAKEDSWISIIADGKTVMEGTLEANNQKSIRAGKQLVLKTGNAAGIEVSYNGKPLGALGKENQVRTLTFNIAGLQQ